MLQQERQAGNVVHCMGDVARCISSAPETIINTRCTQICCLSAGLLRTDRAAHAQHVAGSSCTRYTCIVCVPVQNYVDIVIVIAIGTCFDMAFVLLHGLGIASMIVMSQHSVGEHSCD